jgi:hypothetical protein
MKKKRVKEDFIAEQIQAKTEDIWRMEMVRDFNRTKGTPQAEIEADSAQKRISEIEVEITFLKGYLHARPTTEKA